MSFSRHDRGMNRTPHPPARPAGFSLVETCVAVLVASLAALLLVTSGQSHDLARTQSLNRASAVRLGTELADWARRGGHRDLDLPLAEALAEPPSARFSPDCHQPEPACNPRQAAWHYLLRWRARLQEAIAGARLVVCDDLEPGSAAGDWACDASGSARVLKIGTTGRHDSSRPAAIIDLGVGS